MERARIEVESLIAPYRLLNPTTLPTALQQLNHRHVLYGNVLDCGYKMVNLHAALKYPTIGKYQLTSFFQYGIMLVGGRTANLQ